jgi:hypothetical protein
MRKLLAAITGLVALTAQASDIHGTPVDRPVDEIARTLQANIPALAMDGMCEVSREANGWNFSFRVKADKTSSDEVQVLVRATAAAKSEVRVQGVKIEGGFISSKRKVDSVLTQEWSDRILKLVMH